MTSGSPKPISVARCSGDDMEDEIQEALEAAASPRIKSEMGSPQTPTAADVRTVRRTVSLFLESLDPELTVSELRHHLS